MFKIVFRLEQNAINNIIIVVLVPKQQFKAYFTLKVFMISIWMQNYIITHIWLRIFVRIGTGMRFHNMISPLKIRIDWNNPVLRSSINILILI